jgi:hypothetical protein
MQKSVVFLYANNEESEKVIKQTISLIIATKKNKVLANKFSQRSEILYMEYYKTFLEKKKTPQINGKTC